MAYISESQWIQHLSSHLNDENAVVAAHNRPEAEAGRANPEVGLLAATPPQLVVTARLTPHAPIRQPNGGPEDRPPKIKPTRPPVVRPPVVQPPIVIDPVPTLAPPLRVGDFWLWPDPQGGQAFFSLAVPRLRHFSLTVQRESRNNTILITGGTAVFTVDAYVAEKAKVVEGYQQAWTAALAQAGHGQRSWRFLPMHLRNLQASLQLPSGHVSREPEIATSTDEGTGTFLVGLSTIGVQVWKDALEQRRGETLPGVCSLKITYYAQLRGRVEVREQVLDAPLGALGAALGPEIVHTVNPQLTVEPKVIVAGHQTVETVVIDWRPNQGQQLLSQVFGPEGGQLTASLTSDNVNGLEINWSALVRYRPAGWPVVRESGKLSFAANNWSLIVKPDAWLVEYTFMAMLINQQGQVIASSDSQDLQNRVQGELAFRASFIEGGNPLSTVFETSSQQIVKVVVPKPPGQAPGELKLTIYALRAGLDNMQTRLLRPDETMIVAKVYPNARIEIVTNKDAAPELSEEGQMLSMLEMLK